jgi:hypothetical protein
LAPATAATACPEVVDVRALLARHAAAFGTSEAVARALPRSYAGEVVARGRRGTAELVLDRGGRFSRTTVLGGSLVASGVDAEGPWRLPQAGVLLRLQGDEAVDPAMEAWLGGRAYLDTFDPGRDAATCTQSADGPAVSVHYHLPAIGSPELTFDLIGAALLSATHLDGGGNRTVLRLGGWSEADPDGVRWPSTEASGDASVVTWTRSVAGVECPARPSEDCLAPPRSRLDFSWPGVTPVRVPAAFFLDEILLHTRIGGRAVWALVDSGATVHVVDTGSPLVRAFHPATAGAPAPQGPLTFGEISEPVELGDLVVRHFPAAAVPLPSFDEFGARRPELLIGHPLFLGTAVRIDYARQEVLLASDAAALHSSHALAVPLRVMGEVVVAEGRIDGIAGWFVLDSGDTEALDLFQDWAEAHGFPGPRPTYRFRQRAEVGGATSDERRMRPATFELGPIRLDRPLVALDTVRSPSSRIAGQVGNGVLARCAAVVFDVAHRTLWLEPPCDRALVEDLAGWTLQRVDSPSYPDRPWVVAFVIPGGSADRAGVKAGDRLLAVGDQAAVLERSTFEPVTRQAPGTALPLVVIRGGARRESTLRLVRLLAP